jgi:predicted nucleotidyltransferase
MENQIHESLARIEATEIVRVLYAVESGSRGWGVESATSDWDVRFIYLRPPQWYLSIQHRCDVLDYPLQNDLDIRGWDLTKALRLFAKSNAPLLEWLRAPIVYREAYSTISALRELSARYFSPKACMHHHLNMAQRPMRECESGDIVPVKKYFYALRPVLACSWIETHSTLPPIPFADLAADRLPGTLRGAVDDLLECKRAGHELASVPRVPALDRFLTAEIARLQKKLGECTQPPPPDLEELDQIFLDSLREVWGEAF